MSTKILALHHVLAEPRAPGPQAGECISPDGLRRCLEAHSGWDLVDYRCGLAPADGPTRGRPRLVITFDDGYADVLAALPILEAFEAPFLLFVVTGWLDRTVRPMEADVAWMGRQIGGNGGGAALYARLRRRLARLAPQRQRRELEAMAARHGLDYPPPVDGLLLDADQLAELARHPLATIGSHTVSHPRLLPWDARRCAEEARLSRDRLEALIGRPVECFAFPYGRHSAVTRRAVARAGYRYAFTTQPRLVTDPARVNPMAVPRYAADGPAGQGPLLC